MGQNPASFCLFWFYSNDKYSKSTINDKSVDDKLGNPTQGGSGRRRGIHWAIEAPPTSIHPLHIP